MMLVSIDDVLNGLDLILEFLDYPLGLRVLEIGQGLLLNGSVDTVCQDHCRLLSEF